MAGLLGHKAAEHCLIECVGICCGRIVESEDAVQISRSRSITEDQLIQSKGQQGEISAVFSKIAKMLHLWH